MAAAALRLYRRATLLHRLQALAAVSYAAVFAVVASAAEPGLGIGQAFYIPIVLASLAGTARVGAGAGLLAAVLYELAIVVDGSGGSGQSSLRIGIHLVTYVAAGVIVGSFSGHVRRMLRDALRVLDDLLGIARRDLGTGVLNPNGLEQALTTRIAVGAPFALLVGEIDCRRDDEGALRRVAGALLGRLDEVSEAARVGPTQLAVVTTAAAVAEARAVVEELERAVAETGFGATFGWTIHPAEGTDTLSLFRAASERLYARRIVRGEWAPTPASAGLVDELVQPV